ncbi:MAG TPA: tetratricopeptide repeat protein [Thiotrichales bacterium]|nr:tetratricopeptide repeat protein [Thiotrichales bacterium]
MKKWMCVFARNAARPGQQLMETTLFLAALLTFSGNLAAANFQAPAREGHAGSESCAQCHRAEFEAWQGSQHDRAMQPATSDTVLGDFNDARFRYNGVETRFFRSNGRFMVRTDGPDGRLRDYVIAWTLGVEPLQQYLVEFPGGRLQALGIAWDSRPKDEGGQRWFHLYPDEKVDYRHSLHWTRPAQTWNHQCAECHSTNVKKNYDPASRRYATTWQAIDVGCEACHGPGADHLAWARAGAKGEDDGLQVHYEERRGVRWQTDANTGRPVRSTPLATHTEVESCARCHSRRSLLSEDYRLGQPLTQTHRPALLGEGLYYPDGQIQDEVYVYGSFLQSRMYHAGVTCSDCHEPHSGKTRASGNALCLQCHAAGRFDTPKHHHHKTGARGSACVDCHMPERTYMVVDPRRDHSLRIPRPDLSVALGTPNACSACHRKQTPAWAARQVESWYGKQSRKGYQRYARALFEGRRDGPGASRLLNALAGDAAQPAIARASAVSLLPRYLGRRTLATLQQALADGDALVRMAALGSIERLPGDLRAALASDLLADPQFAVRIEAARVLADAPRRLLDAAQLDTALKEYIASQRLNSDRPEALLNLANLARRRGDPDGARAYLNEALKLQPDFAPAWINLADLERGRGDESRGIAVLRRGLKAAPDNADLHHALGLALIRGGDRAAAVTELQRAARLAPDNGRYAWIQAVALYSTGRRQEAVSSLETALEKHPTDRDILFTLMQYQRELGRHEKARILGARFRKNWPDDPRSRQLPR